MQNALADEFYADQRAARAKELQQMQDNRPNVDRMMNNLPTDLTKYIMKYVTDGPNDLTGLKPDLDKQNNSFTKINKDRKGTVIVQTGEKGIFRPFNTHGTRHIKYIDPIMNTYFTEHMKNREANNGDGDYYHQQS